MSFLSELKIAQAELAARETDHPWKQCLQRVQGKVDYDGLARVSTQTLLDILEGVIVVILGRHATRAQQFKNQAPACSG